MVIVDTSIWIDHFRRNDSYLVQLLLENAVLMHPLIIGELACGNLSQRTEILPLVTLLPVAEVLLYEEVLQFIDKRKIYGQGIGWIDANLLGSSLLSNASLWTRDKSLLRAARSLNLKIFR